MKLRELVLDLSTIYKKKGVITKDTIEKAIADLKVVLQSAWIFEEILAKDEASALITRIADIEHDLELLELNAKDQGNLDMFRSKIILLLSTIAKTVPDELLEQQLITKEEFEKRLKPLDILVVCVGNTDRSPALEALLHYISNEAGMSSVTVRSNGVFPLFGNKPETRAKPYPSFIQKIRGIFPTGKAEPISEESCAQADVILTAAPYISEMIRAAFGKHKDKIFEMRAFVADQERISALYSKERTKGKPYFTMMVEDVTFTTLQEKALESYLAQKEKELGRKLTPADEGTFVNEFIFMTKSDARTKALQSFLKSAFPRPSNQRQETEEYLLKLRDLALAQYLQDRGILNDPKGERHPELVIEFEEEYAVRYREQALRAYPYKKRITSKRQAELISAKELSLLAFAIMRACVLRGYVTSDAQSRKILLYRLGALQRRPTQR